MQPQEDLLGKILGNKRILIIVGVVILATAIISIVLSSGKVDNTKAILKISSQISLLDSYATKAKSTVKDDTVNTKTATALVVMEAIEFNLQSLTGKAKIDKSVQVAQSAHIGELQAALTAAAAIDNYDAAFRQSMAQELNDLIASIQSLSAITKGDTKAVLDNAQINLEAVQKFDN